MTGEREKRRLLLAVIAVCLLVGCQSKPQPQPANRDLDKEISAFLSAVEKGDRKALPLAKDCFRLGDPVDPIAHVLKRADKKYQDDEYSYQMVYEFHVVGDDGLTEGDFCIEVRVNTRTNTIGGAVYGGEFTY